MVRHVADCYTQLLYIIQKIFLLLLNVRQNDQLLCKMVRAKMSKNTRSSHMKDNVAVYGIEMVVLMHLVIFYLYVIVIVERCHGVGL